MIKTICDKCGDICKEEETIVMSGFVGTVGQPVRLSDKVEKHFCGPSCFAEWAVADAGVIQIAEKYVQKPLKEK